MKKMILAALTALLTTSAIACNDDPNSILTIPLTTYTNTAPSHGGCPVNDTTCVRTCEGTDDRTQTSCYLTGKGPDECLNQQIADRIDLSYRKWDFSALRYNRAEASIAFTIDNSGKIKVISVDTADRDFRELIMKKLPSIIIYSCDHREDMVYNITLKYKRM